jgi:hypothetical protein
MIGIEKPGSGTVASVVGTTSGYICSVGSASDGQGNGPIEVRAVVYNTTSPNPPASPPDGAATATINGNNWTFSEVDGASCSASAPYPGNSVVVWARYSGSPTTWESTYNTFQGRSASATDCQ